MSAVRTYRVKDFCKAYGVSRSFAYQEMQTGRLKYLKVGRIRLISYEAAEEWRHSYEAQSTVLGEADNAEHKGESVKRDHALGQVLADQN